MLTDLHKGTIRHAIQLNLHVFTYARARNLYELFSHKSKITLFI